MSDSTPPEIPTAAGMYDYYLGGTTHSAVDKAAAEQILQVLPETADAASANRGFLQRAVRRMATDWGIRQFLDLGSGLPTQRNTHDVVAEVIPDGRTVYVDHDPAAVARCRELLTGVGGVATIEADLRKPEAILAHPQARELLDLTQPVGVLMVAVMHFVPDDDEPWDLVSRYLDAVPTGSYLALSHICADTVPSSVREVGRRVYANVPNPPVDRTRTEIERFFKGLEIVPPYPGAGPGVTFAGLWGAEDIQAADTEGSRLVYAAVARKP